MLAIRMQRTGRKAYPMYRVIVQEAHRQPTSGRVVANLGSYNPHTKEVTLDKERAETFLSNGAQPSGRVVKILEGQKVKLPDWVKKAATDKKKSIKNIEKLRRNQPEKPVEEAEPAEEAEAVAEETPAAEAETPTEATEAKPEEAEASTETEEAAQ